MEVSSNVWFTIYRVAKKFLTNKINNNIKHKHLCNMTLTIKCQISNTIMSHNQWVILRGMLSQTQWIININTIPNINKAILNNIGSNNQCKIKSIKLQNVDTLKLMDLVLWESTALLHMEMLNWEWLLM